MSELLPFDAAEVLLDGSNLIEASAGTGKTYSIGIMALRLVIENGLSVSEILMVTFTKAAVAELQERIRVFVRAAHAAARGTEIADTTIARLVSLAAENLGSDELVRRLDAAVRELDELSVLTIHGFCQKTLSELAFETEQMFGAEILTDIKDLLTDNINLFWRRSITVLPVTLLQEIISGGFSRSYISSLVSNYFSGKLPGGFDYRIQYGYSTEEIRQLTEQCERHKVIYQKEHDEVCRIIEAERETLRALCGKNRHAKVSFEPYVDNAPGFIAALLGKKAVVYVAKLFPDLLELVLKLDALRESAAQAVLAIIERLGFHALKTVVAAVVSEKVKTNLLTYDDLINKLHDALNGKNKALLQDLLQQKYRAVFIDEFQDTDKIQYDIFSTAFAGKTTMFYIGDPKQSIYAWRKADIFTYFRAAKSVDRNYGMNRNFRSSKPMIAAMNDFFLPEADFDTFAFSGNDQTIDYIPVLSPEPNRKGNLLIANRVAKGISIFKTNNNENINKAVAAQVVSLLEQENLLIDASGSQRRVGLTDIGILVRSHKQANEIKDVLAALRIPVVCVNDTLLLQSEEAKQISYVMEALLDISRSTINRALLSPLTGMHVPELMQLDENMILDVFTQLREEWTNQGIYSTLIQFMQKFGVLENYKRSGSEITERCITNLYQLTELLHKTQSNKGYLPTELLAWLKRSMQENRAAGDEFIQRVESDEDAVQIVTIHQSKGLEYNIVLAPYLDLTSDLRDWVSYRDSLTGEYLSAQAASLTPELKELVVLQNEQENRRLLYVAITRAVYKCFLFKNERNTGKSTLSVFVDSLNLNDVETIDEFQPEEVPDDYRFTKPATDQRAFQERDVSFRLNESNWRQVSYTSLSGEHQRTLVGASGVSSDEYDQFIFQDLLRGAVSGNLLHYIFENIHFGHTPGWERIINAAVMKFAPRRADAYMSGLHALVDHIVNVAIAVPGGVVKLGDISPEYQLHELEFDFSFPAFSVSRLTELSEGNVIVNVKNMGEVAGVMNGKMDLFFEHQGRYYILDWKSNYLGNQLDDYNSEALSRAMNDNNYHLQYLLYTFAALKYLRSRIEGFDYEQQFGGVIYLFLRGVRQNADTGIYFTKPSTEKLLQLTGILYNMDIG